MRHYKQGELSAGDNYVRLDPADGVVHALKVAGELGPQPRFLGDLRQAGYGTGLTLLCESVEGTGWFVDAVNPQAIAWVNPGAS